MPDAGVGKEAGFNHFAVVPCGRDLEAGRRDGPHARSQAPKQIAHCRRINQPVGGGLQCASLFGACIFQ